MFYIVLMFALTRCSTWGPDVRVEHWHWLLNVKHMSLRPGHDINIRKKNVLLFFSGFYVQELAYLTYLFKKLQCRLWGKLSNSLNIHNFACV